MLRKILEVERYEKVFGLFGTGSDYKLHLCSYRFYCNEDGENMRKKKPRPFSLPAGLRRRHLKYWVCEGVPRVNVDKTITVIFRSPGELARDIRIVNFSSRHIQKQYIMELADRL